MKLILINLLHGLVAAFLIFAAFQDARKREVSNWISIGIFVFAIILMVIQQRLDLTGLLPGIIMATLYLLGFDKQFRGADIKLLAALGFCLSIIGCISMLFLACTFALAYEGVRYVITREARKYIPFCTWMGIAGIVILAVQIIN